MFEEKPGTGVAKHTRFRRHEVLHSIKEADEEQKLQHD